MKFYVVRSQSQRDRLDWLFESFTTWRDQKTKERIVLWRPGRALGLFFGLMGFFYFGGALTALWWLQMVNPGMEVSYPEMLNPIGWVQLPGKWWQYRLAHKAVPETIMPGGEPLRNALASYATPKTHRVAKPSEAEGRSTAISAISSSLVAGVAPTGPVLTPFFASNGGSEKLLGIYSIEVRGTVKLDATHSLDFTMVKKPPNKVRLNMRDTANGREATVLTNGNETWKWTGDPYTSGVRPATMDEAAALMREIWYCNTAIEIIEHPQLLRELPKSYGGGERFHILQTALPNDMRVQVFVNPETMRADRTQIDYDQDGVPNSYTIIVRDWMLVDGVPEPSRIEVYVNGARLLECTFTSIIFNGGSLDSLFIPPPDAPVAPMPKPATPAGKADSAAPVAPRPLLTTPEAAPTPPAAPETPPGN